MRTDEARRLPLHDGSIADEQGNDPSRSLGECNSESANPIIIIKTDPRICPCWWT